MHDSLLDLIQKRVVLLDGAMGTELMHHGFTQGICPELWNAEKPDTVMSIYKNYYKAGSDAVLTNSFGGSKLKLTSYELEEQCYELNRKSAELAAQIRPEGRFIGGSIGPTGQFLKPQGIYSENDFEKAYFEQAKGLSDGGVDFLLIETQYDLQEARCAFKASKKATDRPVFLTMTFNKTPRGFFTMMGNSIMDLINSFQDEDISGIGANCTLNSKDMADLIKIMREDTTLPLIAQANAGQPEMDESGKVTYNQGIDNYVSFIPDIIKNGANIIGGCCGTDPEYIERIAHIIHVKS
jgi:5-methyltetrahydrofolate--homocysteine methyltransferase